MKVVDVAIVGAGPAGSTCAAFCAAAGLRTLVLEREKFPREKVCGDCINPACWPVLERLELAEEIRNGPHGVVSAVEFIAISGQKLRVDFFVRDDGMISVKRSLFDHLLLNRARTLGAEIREEATLISLDRTAAKNWKIDVVRETFAAQVVVGADGRNSTVARLRNLLPRPERERVALQAHIPLPRGFGNRIVLQFLPEGYSGQAPVTIAN
jgi:menaquinone-9 beta-reductase